MKAFLNKHAVWLTLLPVLAIMIVIFCFSAQKGEASTQTSGRFVRLIVSLFYPNFDQLDSLGQRELSNAISHVVRKTAHFIEYSALGFFLMLHFLTWKRRVGLRSPIVLTQLVGTAYAASDELHQKLVSGREAALSDVVLDSFGVLFGLLLFLALLHIFRKGREARKRRGNGRQSRTE